MSEQQQDRPLWERQPWDTDSSFDKFQKYYLSQPAPRSLPKAYRLYMVSIGKISEPNAQDAPQPNGRWLDWFYAKNNKHEPISGAAGWQARARAYDDHIWQERREWHKRETWEISELGFQRVRDMLAHPLARQRVTQRDEDGRPVTYIIEPANWRARDAATYMATFDKIARLDLGEPTDRTAVSGGADYSTLSNDQLDDAIQRLMAQSGTAATGNLTSPAFGEGEPPENDHETEFEEG